MYRIKWNLAGSRCYRQRMISLDIVVYASHGIVSAETKRLRWSYFIKILQRYDDKLCLECCIFVLS